MSSEGEEPKIVIHKPPSPADSNRQWTSLSVLAPSNAENVGSDHAKAKSVGNVSYAKNHESETVAVRNGGKLDESALSIRTTSTGVDETDEFKFSQVSLTFGEFDKTTLTWSELRVDVPHETANICQRAIRAVQSGNRYKPLGRKQILKNVTGAALPGRVLAIMGASGAGKTTLLNILTQRNTSGLIIAGEVKVNGRELGKNIRSISAYVQQDDLFIGTLKVKEHMKFQAALRLGDKFTKQQKEERVQQVLNELGLNKCANTLIGVKGETKGISGGERKRLAFASEILTNPSLLFCDEPTSGLDSFMAQQVVAVLKELASKGKTIVCTIHQPSSQVFRYFDDLCLLANGRVAYMGPAKGVANLFEKTGYPCPKNFNPADHYIKTLAIVPGQERQCKTRLKQICRSYNESAVAENIRQKTLSRWGDDEISIFDEDHGVTNTKYKANWFTQFNALFWRASIQNIREPMLIQIRLWETIVISLILGLIYLHTDINSKTIQNVNGILFLFVLDMTFTFLYAVVHVFCVELPVFLREHFSHMYRVDVYYIAKSLSELPQYLVLPTIFTTIVYFMAGLTPDASIFLTCVGINILVANLAVSLGYMVSTIFADINLAMSITPILIVPFMLFGGFYVNESTVPVYFIWLQYLSYIKYSYEAISINQWQNVGAIPGCENYTCPVNGTAVLQTLNFDPALFNLDIAILLIMLIVIRLISFGALLTRTYVMND